MKTHLYPLILLLALCQYATAQVCSNVQIAYTAFESRCVATGSIQINATGGSGNFNYRAEGPVNTPYTSASLITGLAPGFYKITVRDLTNNCTRTLDSVEVTGSYADPRFQLDKTNVSCEGNDGTISVINQQFGRAPFTYTIIAPSPSGIGASNASGSFTGLIPGEYAIQLRDSCGGIQVRRITIENYVWWIDSFAVNRIDCDSAGVYIRLRDNRGNTNMAGTAFNGFTYGVVRDAGDTVFQNTGNFLASIGSRKSVILLAKDPCGNIQTVNWTLPAQARPQLGPAVYTNITCSTFTLSFPSQQNLTNPSFCLYNAASALVSCNANGTFQNIPFGQYCVEMLDLCYDTAILHCFTFQKPQPAVSNNVMLSNQTCSTFTAAIAGQANLVNPTYCLLNNSGDTISCNTTGIFAALPYGTYCIRVRNGCNDTTIQRCFTAARPPATLTSYQINGANCFGFNVGVSGSNLYSALYCLYDSSGQVITCDSTGNFTGIPFGNYCIRAVVCGDTTAPLCFSGTRPVPSAGSVQISNRSCSTFTANITGQVNLTAPQYCLYNNADSLLGCNTSGVFPSLAYGAYCIRIKDSCTDSTIVRCFSATRPRPTLNPLIMSNSGCAAFTITVSGTNLTNPQYCVRDTLGNIIACNKTGIFTSLPWGRYCFSVQDSCADTTITVCQTFVRPRGLSLTTSKSCVIGNANVNILFQGGFWPFSVRVFRPNGSLAVDTTSNNNPLTLILPGLPAGGQYKIVGTDACNYSDSAFITPDASSITKSITVNGKCPSALFQNGSGDLVVNCTSNLYATTPVIVRKNGNVFNQSFSAVAGTQFTFSDLEPASYIVEYNMQTCNSKVYDTVTIPPYTFPRQGQSAIYQCDNNSFSLGANVVGGIGPYTYQIIGSVPSTPSIITGVQSSPVFNINTGTVYSLVRLRAIDACGNATLDDASVLPLQNFSVTASDLCFYRNIVLSVNAIPNATYTWYWKTTPTDSVLVGSGPNHNLPFFTPDQIGQYVCIINVHNGCSIRRAVFTLDGNCGEVVLSTALLLKGRNSQGRNEISWSVQEERHVRYYEVLRKQNGNNHFETVQVVPVQNERRGNYQFSETASGSNQYQVKAVLQDGRYRLSNMILLQSGFSAQLYPNPVKDQFNLTIKSSAAANFQVQLTDATGRVVQQRLVRRTTSATLLFDRASFRHSGIYLVEVHNLDTQEKQSYKVLVE